MGVADIYSLKVRTGFKRCFMCKPTFQDDTSESVIDDLNQ